MARGFALLLLTCLFCLIEPVSVVSGNDEALAVIFVLDNSGSMKVNDPDKVRYSAAGMLVDLLHSGDRVGLVSFSSTAKVVVPLSGLDSREQRNSIKTLLSAPENGENWTDLEAGLESACVELEKAQGRGIIVLVSDGKVEPGPGFGTSSSTQDAYYNRLWSGVDRCSVKGWPIYTIGLSGQADDALLQELSARTGGEMFKAANASSLPGIFQDVLENLRDDIPLGEFTSPLTPGQWSEPNLTRVNQGLRLLTFRGLSTGGQGMTLQVTDPQGNVLREGTTGVTVVRGSNYACVSVSNPAAGNWLVQVQGSGMAKVKTAGQSQYSLQVVEPVAGRSLPVNSPVRFAVKVSHNGVPVSSTEPRLSLKTGGKEVLQLNPDPRQPGLFSGEVGSLLDRQGAGRYRLSLEDKTGELAGKDLSYYGLETPYLLVPPVAKGWQGENLSLEAKVMYKGQVVTTGGFKIKAQLSGGNKVWENELKTAGHEDGVYTSGFIPPAAGTYQLCMRLTGNWQGQTVDYTSASLALTVGARPKIGLQESRELPVSPQGILQVPVQSEAATSEQVVLAGRIGQYDIPAQTIQLAPREKLVVKLKVPWQQGGTSCAGLLKLSGPNILGQEQNITVYFRTPWQELWYAHRFGLSIGLLVVVLFTGIVAVGTVLYRCYNRGLRLKGMLVISRSGQGNSSRRLVHLEPFRKSCLTLGWDRSADILLDAERSSGGGNCALVLETKYLADVFGCLAGWLCLLGKYRPVTIATGVGGSFRLKEKTAKRHALRGSSLLQDGDEIVFMGCKILFRR